MSNIFQGFEMVWFMYNSFVQICQMKTYAEFWIAWFVLTFNRYETLYPWSDFLNWLDDTAWSILSISFLKASFRWMGTSQHGVSFSVMFGSTCMWYIGPGNLLIPLKTSGCNDNVCSLLVIITFESDFWTVFLCRDAHSCVSLRWSYENFLFSNWFLHITCLLFWIDSFSCALFTLVLWFVLGILVLLGVESNYKLYLYLFLPLFSNWCFQLFMTCGTMEFLIFRSLSLYSGSLSISSFLIFRSLLLYSGSLSISSCQWAFHAMTSHIFFLIFNLWCSGIFFSLASFTRNLVFYCIIYYKLSVGLAIEISCITFVFYWISGTCLLRTLFLLCTGLFQVI